MSEKYYVQVKGEKDGPLDLVAIMRRVRSGKVMPHTNIFVGHAERPLHAERIPEIAPFFQQLQETTQEALEKPETMNLEKVLKSGWRFTLEHNIMTVYAGGMLLLILLLTIVFIGNMGPMIGGLTSWCLFMIMHNFYFIFTARLYRGQTMGDDFINLQLAPALVSLLLGSIIFACIVAVGLPLLILPGVMIAAAFIFVPLILLDRQCSIFSAFRTSLQINRRAGMGQFIKLCTLIGLHIFCFAVIIPVPLTLPIITSALCQIYEKYYV